MLLIGKILLRRKSIRLNARYAKDLSSTMASHHGFLVPEGIPVLLLKCESEIDTVLIGKMLLRRKTIRLNAEDTLVILKQYNAFPVWLLYCKIYRCFYSRTKLHCCNVNPGP